MKLVLLNTTILTTDGMFECKTITLNEARELCNEDIEIVSAIGHQSTADILTTLLSYDVKMNRIMYKQEDGDICLCFKLNGRPEEGKILTVEEIEKIGYEFKTLIKVRNWNLNIPEEI